VSNNGSIFLFERIVAQLEVIENEPTHSDDKGQELTKLIRLFS